MKAILAALEEVYKQSCAHPVLLFVNGIPAAEQMMEVFSKTSCLYKTTQVVHAEHLDVLKEKLEKAAVFNTLTICTNMWNRGIDIDATQLTVMLTHPAHSRLETQIYGRTGRNGRPGTVIAVYDTMYLLRMYPDLFQTQYSYADKCAAIKKIQARMDTEAMLERRYRQAANDVLSSLLIPVKHCQAWVLNHHPQGRQAFFESVSNFIQQVELAWESILCLTDPDGQYPNPCVRRNEDGQYEIGALEKAFREYKTQALIYFNQLCADIQARLKGAPIKAEDAHPAGNIEPLHLEAFGPAVPLEPCVSLTHKQYSAIVPGTDDNVLPDYFRKEWVTPDKQMLEDLESICDTLPPEDGRNEILSCLTEARLMEFDNAALQRLKNALTGNNHPQYGEETLKKIHQYLNHRGGSLPKLYASLFGKTELYSEVMAAISHRERCLKGKNQSRQSTTIFRHNTPGPSSSAPHHTEVGSFECFL